MGLRVLMLGWEYPPRISGGLGTACRGLVGGLVARGVDVRLVLPRLFGDEDTGGARLVAAGDVSVGAGMSLASPVAPAREPRRVHVESALRPYQTASSYLALLARLASPDSASAGARGTSGEPPFQGGYGPNLAAEVERYARVVGELARRGDFDVIHAHDWMAFPAGLLARRVSGRPLVCHVHASEWDRRGSDGDPAIEAVEQAGLDGADRVVCVSHFTWSVLASRYRLVPERVRVVHNAVTRGAARARRRLRADAPPTVLFLGRLTRQKGPDFFLSAAVRVAARVPDARFVVSGDGDLREPLIERAAALGLARRVFFTGFLGPAEVERAYAEADVYVMPSVSEPFGITPLEALALDTPVIIARDSGVAELLASSPKIVHGDVEDLARKIVTMLERPALRRELARAGRREIARLRWERSAALVEDVYRELVAAPAPAELEAAR